MNPHEDDISNTMGNGNDDADLGHSLRWQLRALRRDEAPARDLWAGIAAALPAQPRAARSGNRLAPIALAASLVLAVGAVGWWQAGRAPGPSAAAAGAMQAVLMAREASGLTRQYEAALQELAPVTRPGSLQPTFAVLDRDAALIRSALEQAPDSRLLLTQLRRTYARRLALAQRVAYS